MGRDQDCTGGHTVNALHMHGLFNTIWDQESVLEDWSRRLTFKKGDLTSCWNWRAIILTSIVAKVLGHWDRC